ncbi:MAG: N-acetylmuramoyl-L-alanine amidase [Alphaproteobacteria bacterium]|nr:N-acetylmuramoyl-L-alanine amidase [Rickettsiales bacterium]
MQVYIINKKSFVFAFCFCIALFHYNLTWAAEKRISNNIIRNHRIIEVFCSLDTDKAERFVVSGSIGGNPWVPSVNVNNANLTIVFLDEKAKRSQQYSITRPVTMRNNCPLFPKSCSILLSKTDITGTYSITLKPKNRWSDLKYHTDRSERIQVRILKSDLQINDKELLLKNNSSFANNDNIKKDTTSNNGNGNINKLVIIDSRAINNERTFGTKLHSHTVKTEKKNQPHAQRMCLDGYVSAPYSKERSGLQAELLHSVERLKIIKPCNDENLNNNEISSVNKKQEQGQQKNFLLIVKTNNNQAKTNNLDNDCKNNDNDKLNYNKIDIIASLPTKKPFSYKDNFSSKMLLVVNEKHNVDFKNSNKNSNSYNEKSVNSGKTLDIVLSNSNKNTTREIVKYKKPAGENKYLSVIKNLQQLASIKLEINKINDIAQYGKNHFNSGDNAHYAGKAKWSSKETTQIDWSNVKNVVTSGVKKVAISTFAKIKSEQDKSFSLVDQVIEFLNYDPAVKRISATNTIIIDPGHGGVDNGMISPNGLIEKNINLIVAKKVKQKLSDLGFVVHMTRNNDDFVGDEERVNIIQKYKPKLVLSIRSNHSSDSSIYGPSLHIVPINGLYDLKAKYSTHSTSGGVNNGGDNLIYDKSKEFALNLRDSLARNYIHTDSKPFPLQDLYTLAKSHYPGALIEIGYITSEIDEALLVDSEYIDALSYAIGNSISYVLVGKKRLKR